VKLKITGEFTYDAELMHSGEVDKEAKQWFIEEVLKGEELGVLSSEIGDEVGKLKIETVDDDTD